MTRRTSWTQAYAIVRRDHLPGHTHDPDDSSPPSICGGEYSFAVKEVVLSEDVAIQEVERLNALADRKETRYFWSGTRLFSDGGSFSGEARGKSPR
jgi:hypothetical protein